MSRRARAAARLAAWTLLAAIGPGSPAIVSAPPAHACLADPTPGLVHLPDGRTAMVTRRGDQYFNWDEDEQGYALTQFPDGMYFYAAFDGAGQLVPVGPPVGMVDPASIGLNPHPLPPPDAVALARATAEIPPPPPGVQEMAQPKATPMAHVGVVKNLVILCRFSDHDSTQFCRAPSAYDSLFNEDHATGINAPTGSVKDYFREVSCGALTLNSTVTVWVTLPHTEAFYANNRSGRVENPVQGFYNDVQGMIYQALVAADPIVNFGDFDQDNDGYIDAITIIHSGYGAEASGDGDKKNRIWSTTTTLWKQDYFTWSWTSNDKNSNGNNVRVRTVHTEPALWGSSGNEVTHIGVICNNLGHFFGLPDLYDEDFSSAGVGTWCLMGSAWGLDGTQLHPPHLSPWCKIRLHWMNADSVTGPGTYYADRAETNPSCWKIAIGYGHPYEYLLIENRQPYGFDSWIPSGGLAIWQIEESKLVLGKMNTEEGFPGQSGWPGNGRHFMVALLQADGRYDLEHGIWQADGTDLYVPGVSDHLDETTTPSTLTYSYVPREPSGNEIDHIRELIPGIGLTIAFDYRPGVWVDFAYTGTQDGKFHLPYKTLATAQTNSATGWAIICKSGTTSERPLLNQPRLIKTYQGITTIGN